MQVTVKDKFIHQAPRKLRLVVDTVRGLPADKAVAELSTISQVASQAIRKTILSGIAAARQKGLGTNLFVSQIMVNEGPKLRRMIPLSRGRSQRIHKKMSHLTISISDEPMTIASSRAYRKETGLNKTKQTEGSK